MEAPFDLRPTLAAAFTQAETVIGQVRPDQLDAPTPCTELDVRGLLGHLLFGAARIDHVGRGGFFADSPQPEVPSDPAAIAARYTAAASIALDAWSNDETQTAMFQVPWGDSPGFAVVGAYAQEVITHTWDLAQGIGFSGLDPALAEAVLPLALQHVPAEIRADDAIPFGPVVEVADDADPYLRLAGWLGRRPLVSA